MCHNAYMDTEEVKRKIVPILQRYNVMAASVFGSVARGEASPKSDVDLLVKIGKLPFGIWGFVALKQDLEEALKRKVDVVSERGINARLKKNIQKDLTPIYEGA